MPTATQAAKIERELREYRKKYLTKKQNLEVDESATRIMVNSLLTSVLGYAELDDIKTEYNIRGTYADDVIRAIRLRLKKNCGISFDQLAVADAVQDLLLSGHEEAVRPKVLKV